MFNKWQAQRWWADNCEKVMELYNVQKLNRQAFPLPSTPRSEDGSSTSKMESIEDSPVTPPLGREPLPRTLYRPAGPGMAAYSSSDSLDQQSMHSRSNLESLNGTAANSTPKLSSISGAKTETSSMRTSSSRDVDRSGEISISNASDLETEWVEQDEPGVYITIRALPDGKRELRRVRFRLVSANKLMQAHNMFKSTKITININLKNKEFAIYMHVEYCMNPGIYMNLFLGFLHPSI